MVVQLRQVTRQDAERLVVLLGHLGCPTDGLSVRERLHDGAGDPASVLISADDDGVLIGVAAVHAMPMLEVPGRLRADARVPSGSRLRGPVCGERPLPEAAHRRFSW